MIAVKAGFGRSDIGTMKPWDRRVAARALIVVGLMIVGAACSSSASPDPDTASLDDARTEESLRQWRQQSRALCEQIKPETEAIDARFGDTNSPEETVAFLDASMPVIERYVAAQLAIPVPQTQTADVERFNELLELQPARATNMRRAAAAQPTDRAAFNAEAMVLNVETEELDALADRLGIEVCIA